MAERCLRQKTEAVAIKTLFAGKTPEVSDKVNLDAPEIAENGAVVPISVSTTLPDVTSIAIMVSENPFPLAANYPIPAGTTPMIANRLKMAKTSKVCAGHVRRQSVQREQRSQSHSRRLRRLSG